MWFGLDFPRWGFSYGPNGIYIRGGNPRDVVIVEPGVVVAEEVVPAGNADVEIRELSNLPKVHAGATVSLSSKTALGEKAGQVFLEFNGITLPPTVVAWSNESTTCTLPMMGMDGPREARLIMVTAEGVVAHTVAIQLLPPKAPEAAPQQ